MYQYQLKCPKGHTTDEVESYVPTAVTKFCYSCNEAIEFKPLNKKEIGECEACRDPEELDWECMDEPHHGTDTECGECNATYYQDFGGEIYTTNEQAKKNFPQLKTL